MFTSIAKSLFGDSNERVLKKFYPLIEQINSLEQKIEALDKDEIVKKSNNSLPPNSTLHRKISAGGELF